METVVGLIFLLAPVAIGGGVVAAMYASFRRQVRAFRAMLEHDPDVEVIEGTFGTVGCRTKRAPFVSAFPGGGGKNNPKRWDVTGLAPRFGARTSLHVSREGIVGDLRERLGFKDIHTGDDAFDKALTVRGSEPDVVRGVCRSVDVKNALRALFETARSFQVSGERGVVIVHCARHGIDGGEARAAALAAARVIEQLEEHADDPAVAPPLPTSMSGGASGASVGVPL